MSFSELLIDFHINLEPPKLKDGISWINPFVIKDAVNCMTTFYRHNYADCNKRRFWFGINPGRLGAGITGVPFTDPLILEEKMGISNCFAKRQELSARLL